jgi:hypothetical protein
MDQPAQQHSSIQQPVRRPGRVLREAEFALILHPLALASRPSHTQVDSVFFIKG